jgi:hypothetical protein
VSKFSGVLKNRDKLPDAPEPASEPEPTTAVAPLVAESPKLGRPGGKKGHPDYVQVTVYLKKTVHRTARKLLFDEGKQFSDLVGELVDKWISDVQKSGHS